MTNEIAEWMLRELDADGMTETAKAVREALAVERKATVERIRKIALEVHHPDSWFIAQLDAEAAR